MKKFFLILFASFSLLALNSCKSDDEQIEDPVPVVPTPEEPEEPEVPEVPVVPNDTTPDYLIMHYSHGSKDLDQWILSNVFHALDEGSNDKVKMTFQYKLASVNQTAFKYYNIDFTGTRRFTADDNKQLVGKYNDFALYEEWLNYEGMKSLCGMTNSELFADRNYAMSCADGLGDFIKWSKEQYPDAKRTILVIAGHGLGWRLENDGLVDSNSGQSRSLLFMDDNLTEVDSLTLNETIEGIRQGGGVDLLYTDDCLMCMYENFYGYANCAKYLLSSFNEIPGRGGNYSQLLKLLKGSGNNDQEFEDAMCKYVDVCTSNDWWGKDTLIYSDLGFYNLTKLDLLTPVLKKLTDTLTVNYKTFEPYIHDAVRSCEMSWHAVRYIKEHSYSISDMVRILDKNLDAAGEKNNPFKEIRQELIEAFKSIAYIKKSGIDDIHYIDQDYELCTPGVNIIPFNEDHYYDIGFYMTDKIPNVYDAISIYQNLDFDKQVGWSRFLQLIDVCPSTSTNYSRDKIKL